MSNVGSPKYVPPGTTKGDLLVHNGTELVRLPVSGVDGRVLSENSATATGTEWIDNAGGPGGASDAEDVAYDDSVSPALSATDVQAAIDAIKWATKPHSMRFGNGADGNITISAGTTTLSAPAYYNNLTLNGTGVLSPSRFRVFVAGTLDITAAQVGAVLGNGITGNSPANQNGGSGGSGQAVAELGASNAGGSGGSSTTTTGVTGSANTTVLVMGGGRGGTGGTGGSGAGGSAVAANTGGLFTAARSVPYPADQLIQYTSGSLRFVEGGSGGGGGSGGAGSGTQTGGGGGGGGSAGHVLYIAARRINRGASTPAGCVTVNGGNGGNGFTPANVNTGGGAGGGGGGGGYVYLMFEELLGSSATFIRANGGSGGTGANGQGTGQAGTGGNGGNGGRVTLIDLKAGTVTETTGSAGSAASGTTGGAGGTLAVTL